MSEIKSRQDNPVPGIDYSEIRIPDGQHLGTGTFMTVLEANALAKINPLISSIVNEPVFKLFINIQLVSREVIALIGKADKSPPLDRKVFQLPEKPELSDVLRFEVIFKDWKITGLKMNGTPLIEA